jgi:hypothetical protein
MMVPCPPSRPCLERSHPFGHQHIGGNAVKSSCRSGRLNRLQLTVCCGGLNLHKSRRDDTLLTVGFSLRTSDRHRTRPAGTTLDAIPRWTGCVYHGNGLRFRCARLGRTAKCRPCGTWREGDVLSVRYTQSYKHKSRRDDTLLTVGFSLRTSDRHRTSPAGTTLTTRTSLLRSRPTASDEKLPTAASRARRHPSRCARSDQAFITVLGTLKNTPQKVKSSPSPYEYCDFSMLREFLRTLCYFLCLTSFTKSIRIATIE